MFPDEQINVTPSRSAIVLSGHVSTEDVAKRAGMIAEAYSKNVVNVLTFGPVGAQEVLLEVKFAEVDRAAAAAIGRRIPDSGHRPHHRDRDHRSIRRVVRLHHFRHDHHGRWHHHHLHRRHPSHRQPHQPV